MIPEGPVVTSPTKGEEVDANSLTVSWEPVTKPDGLDIVSYQVIVAQEPSRRDAQSERRSHER